MKLTYLQIESILNNSDTKNLLDKATGAFGIKLARFISKISAEIPVLSEQIDKIKEKYGQKDEDGNPKTRTTNGVEIIDFGTKLAIATTEILKIKGVEIDIQIDPIDFDPETEGNSNITASEILAIMPLLADE